VSKPISIILEEIKPSGQKFLFEMLFQSVYVKPGAKPYKRDILNIPEIRQYAAGWGREGDLGFFAVAKSTPKKIGAAWLRYFVKDNKSYGYIADDIPELAIAVDVNYRNLGIGSALLQRLLDEIKTSAESICLSVDYGNPAIRLYERFGFYQWATPEDSLIMRCDF